MGKVERFLVKVWNLTIEGEEVKVATVEQGPRKPSMCHLCSAPCCKGFLHPVLTGEELFSRKFPTEFILTPAWLKKEVPNAEKIATLAVDKETGCPYLKDNKCTIWPNCPKGCLSYDCREDTRPEIKSFVDEMEIIWQEASVQT